MVLNKYRATGPGKKGYMDTIGACSQCSRPGFYNMTIPSIDFVVVCKRCEYTFGNKNLITAGYRKLRNGSWTSPDRNLVI